MTKIQLTIDGVLIGTVVHSKGDVVEVFDDIAKRYLANGHATKYVEPPKPVDPPKPEPKPVEPKEEKKSAK